MDRRPSVLMLIVKIEVGNVDDIQQEMRPESDSGSGCGHCQDCKYMHMWLTD